MKKLINPTDTSVKTVSINGNVEIKAGDSLIVLDNVAYELAMRYGFLIVEDTTELPPEPKPSIQPKAKKSNSLKPKKYESKKGKRKKGK